MFFAMATISTKFFVIHHILKSKDLGILLS